jgi:uncharacterized protein (TIGR00290 family)
MQKAIFNWSGGKDSSLSLFHVLEQKEYEIKGLLTATNKDFGRVCMHGVRVDLLRAQARALGLPLHTIEFSEKYSMEDYDNAVRSACQGFVVDGIESSIFGDIFLEDLRQYREKQLAQVNMKAVFPIWKRPTPVLAEEFINLGFKAVIVCVSAKRLGKSFVGREFDEAFLKDLPKDVDPCGENGEFHTFVYDGPIFKTPIQFKHGEIIYREYNSGNDLTDNQDKNDTYYQTATRNLDTGFWYCDLLSI